MTNNYGNVFYTGVTNNLRKRVTQHKTKYYEGFTSKYNLTKLVYFEIFSDIQAAIVQEKRIKHWRRVWKIELILNFNPQWQDLYSKIMNW
jgi:putative endonuclease